MSELCLCMPSWFFAKGFSLGFCAWVTEFVLQEGVGRWEGVGGWMGRGKRQRDALSEIKMMRSLN